ncbi:MAG TPA: Wzz/FepE/Etk N-terminal domain-containing protein [Candidatus Kapabacteria bacterium]|nr:Wzz/FepE/Etk N-terminal domain-containing protein [Candidatus Kapabacteria bacterium]
MTPTQSNVSSPNVTTQPDVLSNGAIAAGPATTPTLSELTPSRVSWVSTMSLLLRHKWLIAITALIVTVGTGIYAFTLPNVYTATTVVLPPRKAGGGMLDNLASGLSSTIKDLGITSLKGSDGSAYNPLSLINSREIRETLIREFDLVKRYDVLNVEAADKILYALLNAKTTEYASFSIGYTDEEPKIAAKLANRAVELMNETNNRLAQEEAANNLAYVEKRYAKLMADLDAAESKLSIFQRQYGVYSMTEQAKAQATAIAAIEQQKYTTEVQLRMYDQLYGSNSAEVNALRTSIAELNNKLDDLRSSPDANSSFLATKLMPKVAMEYLRTMREVEIQSKLKAFLLPAFEQAKLDVNKETVAFLVLDKAVPPIKKSGPRRSVILLVAMLGSVFATSFLIVNYYKVRSAQQRFQRDQQSLGLR